MKVIFLDFDGVLNGSKDIARGVWLDNEKVLLLDRICVATGANIVISSVWRLYHPQREMQALLRCTGCQHGEVVGMTGRSPDGIRGKEIKEWLDEHEKANGDKFEHIKVESYVIIDDSSDMLDEQKPYFVHTFGGIGITEEDADKAIEILST